jgi:hypothetical protein
MKQILECIICFFAGVGIAFVIIYLVPEVKQKPKVEVSYAPFSGYIQPIDTIYNQDSTLKLEIENPLLWKETH